MAPQCTWGGGGELVSEPGRDRWAQIAAHQRARPRAAPAPPRPAPPPPTRLADRCAALGRPADRGPSAPGALPSAEARAGPDLGPAARGARRSPARHVVIHYIAGCRQGASLWRQRAARLGDKVAAGKPRVLPSIVSGSHSWQKRCT